MWPSLRRTERLFMNAVTIESAVMCVIAVASASAISCRNGLGAAVALVPIDVVVIALACVVAVASTFFGSVGFASALVAALVAKITPRVERGTRNLSKNFLSSVRIVVITEARISNWMALIQNKVWITRRLSNLPTEAWITRPPCHQSTLTWSQAKGVVPRYSGGRGRG